MVDLVNIAGKRGNLGINDGDASAVNVEFVSSSYRTVERNRPWSNNSTGIIYACEYDELLCYTKSMWWRNRWRSFKYANNHSYRLLYIQLDVITFETILCQFRFTVFRGLPRFFLLNKAKLSRNWPWLYAATRRTRLFCEAFSFKVISTYPRVLIHWRVCSPYFRAPFR